MKIPPFGRSRQKFPPPEWTLPCVLTLNVSQETLARRVNITFQQVQKYESGVNRIAASRLVQLADALGVAPDYFLAGLSAVSDPSPPEPWRRAASDVACLKLVDMFSAIESKAVRAKVLHLVEAVPKGEG